MLKVSKKRATLATVLLVTSGAIFFGLLFYVFGTDSRQFTPVFVDNIQVKDKKFEVSGAKVSVNGQKLDPLYQMAIYDQYLPYVKFYSLSKTDPLFASNEIDVAKFKDSVSLLEEKQAQDKKDAGITTDIVPTHFLSAVAEVSAADDRYLKEPNVSNGQTLVGAYRVALKEYRSYLNSSIAYTNKYYPEDKTQEFNYLDSLTTNQIIISDLKLALKNSDELEKEINSRAMLIEGKETTVKSMKLSSGQIGKYDLSSRGNSLLSGDQLGVGTNYLNQLNGPYLTTTSCFGKQSVRPFYVYNEKFYNRAIFMPKLADNNYYLKINNQMPIYEPFLASNVSYELLSEGNSYRCNDLTYMADLLTMDEFRNKYGVEGVSQQFGKNLTGSQWTSEQVLAYRDLVSYEDQYYNDQTKTYQNLSNLGGMYLDTYVSLSSGGSNEQREALESALLARGLLIKGKQSGLDRVLNSTFFMDYLFDFTKSQSSDQKIDPHYLVARSAYSFSLLNFSPAVWRINDKPIYLKDKSSENRAKSVVTYPELVKVVGNKNIALINQIRTKLQTMVQR